MTPTEALRAYVRADRSCGCHHCEQRAAACEAGVQALEIVQRLKVEVTERYQQARAVQDESDYDEARADAYGHVLATIEMLESATQ